MIDKIIKYKVKYIVATIDVINIKLIRIRVFIDS